MTSEKADIIILDDNKDISSMMESILQFAGYKTFVCSAPDQLYSLLAQLTPRLIMMDMLLAGTNGSEICRKLKNSAATSDIPVMMISAHPDAEVTCKEAGADDFLEKPFGMDILISKTKALL
jgi:DNA-binding response OmpR family regulator